MRGTTQPTSTAPRHRWVNTGGFLTPEPRQKSSTRKTQSKHSKPASGHSRKAAHASKHDDRTAKAIGKSELKRCKGLSQRQLKRNSKCQAALKAEKKAAARKAQPAKSLSKAETRRCKKMSYSQLLRNKDCAALLQRELEASQRTKHRSSSGKATKSHHKANASPKSSKKTAKHHRS